MVCEDKVCVVSCDLPFVGCCLVIVRFPDCQSRSGNLTRCCRVLDILKIIVLESRYTQENACSNIEGCGIPNEKKEWVSESAGDAARSHNLALHIYSPTDSLALQVQLSIIFDEGIIQYLNICSAYSI